MTASPELLSDAQRALLARMSASPGERAGLFPLTAAQRSLWFLDQLRPGDTAYHMPALLRLRGRLDERRLAAALQRVVDRHESLRTTFVAVDGRPLQRVQATQPPGMSIVDRIGRDPAEVVREAIRSAHEPFDLACGPLVRSVLWRLADDDHLLLLVVHHIVADGWSVGLLLADLDVAFAGGTLTGTAPGLCPVDLALREAASASDTSASHWVRTLAGVLPSGLPDRVELPPEQACRTTTLPLPAHLTTAVGGFARQHRDTDHAVHLAALAAVCHRFTGRSDVVIGVPHARRSGPETQGTVGLLVNTLPVRVRWDGDPSFAELVSIAGRATRAAIAHGDVPFDMLVDQIAGPASADRAALFDLMLTITPELLATGRLGNVDVEVLPVPARAPKFPLTLGVERHAGHTVLRCEYHTARFDEEVVHSLVRSVRAFLAAASTEPNAPLSALTLPDTDDTVERPPPPPDSPGGGGGGLGEAVAEVAARTPDAVAVVDPTGHVTYGELIARAGRLAAVLRARCGEDVLGRRPVAVYLAAGVEHAVACLAVVLAGGHSLVLDPGHPVERHWEALARSEPCLLLGTSAGLDELGPAGAGTLAVDRLESAVDGAGGEVARLGYPAALAAVTADGLTFTHAALATLAAGARPAEAYLHAAGPSTPSGLLELWCTLLTGSRGVVVGPDLADGVAAAVTEHGVTTVALTGRQLRSILVDRPSALSAVGELVVDGHPGGTRGQVRRPDGRVHVLDAALRPVPVGAVGEVYIGGAATGIHNRPAATADRFVPSPFDAGERLYRTGERAVRRADGSLLPADAPAERWLLGQADILDAAVLVRDDVQGNPGRVAYVVPAPGASPDHAERRARLARRLPPVEVPDVFVDVPRIPLDADGEPDAELLPPPARTSLGATRSAPADGPERSVAAAWADVLDVDLRVISRDDNFFHLGGHSLLASRLVARLSRDLGRAVPVQLVFDHPTLRAMAAAADRQDTHRVPPPRPLSDHTTLPLSFAQQRLWFMQTYDPASPMFNMPLAVALTGALNVAALHDALRLVVGRHETLRGTVCADGDRPVIRVPASGDVPLSIVDVSAAGDPPDAAAAVLEQVALVPFDLTSGPPLRAVLVRVTDVEHLLLLVVHHIACDGWSVGLLAGELSEAYAARVAGRRPSLPELPVQYGDFAAWQRETQSDDALRDELAHWCETLSGAPPALDLPTDHPRPAVFRRRGGTRPVRLAREVTAAARTLAQDHEVTSFMALLAALALVLRRVSGQDDIVIGTPVAGRPVPEVDRLVGCFVDVVPLRVDLTGDPTVRELLARVRSACLDAYGHQDVPFERLVEHLRPDRDLSRTPVFQVMLALESGTQPNLDLPGVTAKPYRITTGTAQHDLTLWLREQTGEIGGHVEFNADVLADVTVDRMVARVGATLRALAAGPEARLSTVDALAPGERAWLAQVGTGPVAPVPSGTVAAAVLAEDRGDRVAVLDGRDVAMSLSYAALRQDATRVAGALVARGVRRGDVVAVLADRSPAVVPVLLGVWLAGAAYVPLDPRFPLRRLGFMLSDSGATVLAAASPAAAAALVSDVDIVGFGELLAGPSAPVALPAVRGGDRAYVMYTSGSTGRPKGVLVPHAAVLNLLSAMTAQWRLGPADTLLAVTTLSFDISVLEVFGPLLAGARLVLASAAQAGDPVLLGELLATAGATAMQATPSTWRMLLESGWHPPPGFRAWCGGEALPPEVAAGLREAGVATGNLYGPTETTIWSTVDPAVDPADIALGRPIVNTDVLLLDDRMRPIPAGAVGELYVGGAGVADGYHGRPGLTAQRFLPSPLRPGERLYRTGDLARFGHDGRLRFAGRSDGQVKIRGHRVELGEVEARLAAHPAVAEAVVAVREDRLVAYVVPGERPPDAAELTGWARDFLPDHMVPAATVVLDRVPRTPNGKTDRGALPAPARAVTPQHVAPRTELEATVAAVWADVLGLADGPVSVLADFFALGGHSMLATRVAGRLSELTGRRVSVRQVFEHPTVAALAAELSATAVTDAAPARPHPVRIADRDLVPLSFAQQRLWFLHRLEGPSPSYNIPVALRLSGTLDPDALTAALEDVLSRHESLRTVFPDIDGIARQIVVEPGALPVPLTARAVAEPELAAAIAGAARYPFDLTSEIPLRGTLFRLSAEEHVLLVVVHHIAGDEASLRPFLTDLATAYTARCAGAEPFWAPLPVQYPDYAIWQRRVLGGTDAPDSVLGRQLAFWRDALAELPTRLALPVDRLRRAEAGYRGGTVGFALDPALCDRLGALARRCGATPFMVLQAAVATLLSKLGAGPDIPLGTPIDARADGALDDLVGMFLNTLVLRADTSGNPTFAELVARVRDRDLAAFDNADLPFEQLVEALNPPRVVGVHPLFQVAVAYRHAVRTAVELPRLSVHVEHVEPGAAKFDLGFTFTERDEGGGVDGLLGYAADLFDASTAAGLADQLVSLLSQVLSEPDGPIGTVDLVGEPTRHRLLAEWNDTASGQPSATFPDLFEARVAAGPDRVAVVHEIETMTYAELDVAANRLAHLLIERGAGPDTLVALVLPRSADVVVAMLAVLKAGAGYLPIDPDHPASRTELVLADADPVLVLCTRALARALPPRERVVLLDDPAVVESLDHRHDQAPTDADRACPLVPANLAYVIYTSGSTGMPKGVMVTHTGVVKLVATAVERFGVGPDSRVLQFASVAFDVAFWELCMSLLVGGRLVIVPADRRVPGRPLTDYLAEHGVTHLALPPSLLAVLPADCAPPAGATVLTGSETVPAEVVARFGTRCRLLNAYGPTESTVNSTLWPAPPGWQGESVPIGMPDADTRAYVLDAMRLVPPGVVGELYLAGPGLARGYLGRPGTTAAAFVPDPFHSGGGRLYRTGDLARWTAAGALEFHGRVDDQVQIRGFRVEPGEVEAALVRHPDIREAAVVVDRGTGQARLVAYVVPARPDAVDVAGVRAHLTRSLPTYLVPAVVVFVDAIPRAASGKVDRGRLPAPEPGAPGQLRNPPTTALERTAADVVCEVLQLAAVGLHDDLFELGGHSLQIPRIVAGLTARTGVEVPLREVFLAPTVAGLTDAVRRNQDTSATAGIVAVDRRARRRRPEGGSR